MEHRARVDYFIAKGEYFRVDSEISVQYTYVIRGILLYIRQEIKYEFKFYFNPLNPTGYYLYQFCNT
jgi:hypothetical protein